MPAVPARRAARRGSRRSLRAPVACSAAVVLLLAGCGNDRQAAPDVRTPGPRFGTERADFPQAGVTIGKVPVGWARAGGDPPAVATIATGQATVGIFRYPRTEPLPKTAAQLDAAASALVAAAKARDPSFTEIKSAHFRVDGHPGVQIRASETIDGQQRTVRTTHVYAYGAELVIDAYAPDASFRRVDAQSFMPLLRSIRLRAPKAGA